MEYHHRLNINFLFLIKILTLTIITWMCYVHNEPSNRKSLNKIHKQGKVDLRYKRLLSKYMYDEENFTESNESLMYNTVNQDLKWKNEYGINNNRRRCKPNIFKRIDQHFEKKIFSAFDEVANFEIQSEHNPSKVKKKILKTVIKVLKPQLMLLLLATILILFSSSLPVTFEKSGIILMIISLLGGFYVLTKALKYAWRDASSYLKEMNI